MASSIGKQWLIGAALVLVAFGQVCVSISTAQEQPAVAKTPDTYPVPDGSVAELLEFIESVPKMKFKGDSLDAYKEHAHKIRHTIVAAADTIVMGKTKGDEATEAQTIVAVHAKIEALSYLGALAESEAGEKRAQDQIKEFLAGLKIDDRPKLAKLRDELALKFKFLGGKAPSLDSLDMAQSVDDMVEYLGTVKLDQSHLHDAVKMAQQIAASGDKIVVAVKGVLRDFANVAAKSKTDKLVLYGKKLQGMARRMELEGRPLEMFGKYLDGSDIDWVSFRGKVVLVDFWATWCGPCIGEIPNVKKNYEKYHDRGFEVVAVSLDTDRDRVEAFLKERELPWKTLFGDEAKALAVHYDVSSIPSMFLVDRKGMVASLSARGPALEEELEKLLGKADSVSK